jgi:NADH-quinone oxidoreductase subunit F
VTESSKGIDLSILSPIFEKYAGRNRDALLPILHECQDLIGWLPREVQHAIGETLRVPLADIHGVIEFYSMFYNEPKGRKIIRVCEDLACMLAGSDIVMATLENKLGLKNFQTDLANDISLEYVPCLGMCDQAPAALFGEKSAGKLSAEKVLDCLEGDFPESETRVYGTARHGTKSIGKIDPGSINNYMNQGGFEVLRQITELDQESVIDLLEQSGMLGRGGAMFPLGQKWRFTRGTINESRHIVVNADESEPGTYKDRVLMEGDPFSVIEASIIAGYVVGAQQGWIFVRGEYPLALQRLKEAVRQTRTAGYLGQNIFGQKGFNFEIEIRKGAGAYICGEETALFEAIEGKRGFPRIKPPFPTTSGLFNQPTAINNVETLVMSLVALRIGVEKWRSYGTQESPGTKLFCLSGHVNQPGLYEVPFGMSIRELISLGGGVSGSGNIQAMLLGGAAGVFVGPELLDLLLTYEDAAKHGVPLGSGVVMVFDDSVDMRQVLIQIGSFFAHESCGKCFPCQLGTQRQLEILQRNAMGEVRFTDKQLLSDVGLAMKETSLCGLGQTAATAVISALELWPEKFE